jgi:hypothetical protein
MFVPSVPTMAKPRRTSRERNRCGASGFLMPPTVDRPGLRHIGSRTESRVLR